MVKNRKTRGLITSLIITALLFFCSPAYNQKPSVPESVKGFSSSDLLKFWGRSYIFTGDSLLEASSAQLLAPMSGKDRNQLFYDSLKIKASKSLFTRKLYDVMVVRVPQTENKRISSKSEAVYKSYSGIRIRKIHVQRLNVFGTRVNDPAYSNPNSIENLLNKTHVNTNENIIRKNLLFSEGDTISPLILSDNERILRQLSYIDDARIIILPVSSEEADILVITKDVYSLGASYSYKGLKRGSLSVFDKNILGIGHELGIDIPFDERYSDSPGFGGHYLVNNIMKSFINLNVYYQNGLGKETYGFNATRSLVSSSTKYAGGISIRQMYTTEDLDTLPIPEPLKYNLQDYWLLRSFLLNQESVSRLILGARYTNNNVFEHPLILPDSYHYLQKYQIYMASAALSFQKFYKSNLIYGYGRTEDIPYGGLLRFTAGREFNEFKQRNYGGAELSVGQSVRKIGYIYAYAGAGAYFNGSQTEQGLMSLRLEYFSNLLNVGNGRIRNFINAEYTRGFGRYMDECLYFRRENGFSGFRNDTASGNQRFSLSLESVLFSQYNLYGFKFAWFGFADFSFLSGSDEILDHGYGLSSVGVGVRIRNDNLLFNTLQIRFSFFPNHPPYSRMNHLTVSGEQLLRPENFDSGPPAVIPYR